MEIIQVCPLFAPYIGGVETHVGEISKYLTKLGLTIKIYTTDPTGKLPSKQTFGGIEVFRFKSYSPKRVYFFSPKLYSALRSGYVKNADIIHVHAYPNFPALAGALSKSKNGKPLVFTPHYGGYATRTLGTNSLQFLAKKGYNSLVGKYLFNKADIVALISLFEKEFLLQRFGLGENKIRYVPNGINFTDAETENNDKRQSKNLLYVGRLERYKGVHLIIEALQKAVNRMPDLKLVVVGNGPFKNELTSLASKLGVENNVTFLGNVSEKELVHLYMSSRLFITLPQYEPFGITIVEAMAYGLPVIATNVGGVPELIDHNKTGFLLSYPPGKDTLSELITFLVGNTEYSNRIGLNAKRFIRSKFSWERTAKSLFEIYKECLNAN